MNLHMESGGNPIEDFFTSVNNGTDAFSVWTYELFAPYRNWTIELEEVYGWSPLEVGFVRVAPFAGFFLVFMVLMFVVEIKYDGPRGLIDSMLNAFSNAIRRFKAVNEARMYARTARKLAIAQSRRQHELLATEAEVDEALAALDVDETPEDEPAEAPPVVDEHLHDRFIEHGKRLLKHAPDQELIELIDDFLSPESEFAEILAHADLHDDIIEHFTNMRQEAVQAVNEAAGIVHLSTHVRRKSQKADGKPPATLRRDKKPDAPLSASS